MKSVLITGVYSPLGRAICTQFLSTGYNVYGTTTNPENHDDEITTLVVDITKEAETEKALSTISELDVLVNNAGIFTSATPEELTLESFESVFAVNLRGLFLVTRKLLPLLEKSDGSIVNISSMNSLHPGFGGTAHYDASKGAVSAYTRSLARELAKDKIRVNAVAPGVTRTDMVAALPQEMVDRISAGIPLGRMGEPLDIANAYLYLASDLASYVTGVTLRVDGAAMT